MLSNDNSKQRFYSQNSRFWVKDMRRRTRRRRTTVILASRAAPPQAAGSQKGKFVKLGKERFKVTII